MKSKPKRKFEDVKVGDRISFFFDYDWDCVITNTPISKEMHLKLRELVEHPLVQVFNKVLHILSIKDDHIFGIYQVDEFYYTTNFYYG